MKQPMAIDLFCGLGGWTEGLLAEGYRVVGFDIERHRYAGVARAAHVERGWKSEVGSNKADEWSERSATGPRDMAVKAMREGEWSGEWMEYPAQLVIQDVLTIHGKQFKDAALIVASPPCQEYSYMAMPWSRAKQKAKEYRDGTRDVKQLTALFDACFRIQREACEAAGRHIPLVVENVRGAQPWVGRSRWNFGSFHLWGDVPALMPMTLAAVNVGGIDFNGYGTPGYKAQAFNGTAEARLREAGIKTAGRNLSKGSCRKFGTHNMGPAKSIFQELGIKQSGISGPRANGKGDLWFQDGAAKHGSKSPARKAASAMIAKIPLVLSRHIAAVWKPEERVA